MVGENTKERSPLLPNRREQGDFFVCDIFDAVSKGDMASMEHPIFSLSTKPDTRIRRYKNGRAFIEITPSVKGLATVHDRDVLIFCISQVMAALNRDQLVSKVMRFKAYDLLKATNRGTDGRGYEQLKSALERLLGTIITTNITTGDVEVFDGFGLIDKFRLVRETRDGRMLEVEITLSDWVFNAIRNNEVLTMHHDYFRLRKPLERRLYEVVRKHLGKQKEFKLGLKKLKSKAGSNSTDKEFKRLIKKIIKDNDAHHHIPDFIFRLEGNMFIASPRPEFTDVYNPRKSPRIGFVYLKPETHKKAQDVAPGWDIHYLEQEWRNWMKGAPVRPDAAFIGFCKKWFEKRGRP